MIGFNIDASSAEQCQARLDTLQANPQWRDLVLQGQEGAVREFRQLTSKITGVPDPGVASAPVFTPTEGASIDLFAADAESKLPLMTGTASASHTTPSPTPRETLRQIEYLRDEGFPELAIREMFDEGRSYTPAEVDLAKTRLAEFESDPEFRRKLFEGSFRERYLINCVARILSGGVKA
jgi:hypothetical protein